MAEREAKTSPISKQRQSRKSNRRQNQNQTGKVVSEQRRQTGTHSSNRGGRLRNGRESEGDRGGRRNSKEECREWKEPI